MIYIYDIVLNYTNNYYYDFYEWDVKDNLVNIKKIPLIKVDKLTIDDFINNKVKINKRFLNEIKDKSIFLKKDKNKYDYSVLLSDSIKGIGVCFDKNGNVKYISSMLLDEEDDANRRVLKEKEKKLDYIILGSYNNQILRCDIDKKNKIIKEIKNDYVNKKIDKLKYIYYEIYNELSNDIDVIYNRITNEIDDIINNDKFTLEKLIIK